MAPAAATSNGFYADSPRCSRRCRWTSRSGHKRTKSPVVTVPAADIAIAACARRHGATLESADKDFERLAGVGATDPG